MTCSLVPVRAEHEVVDDELAPGAEQTGQRLLAVRAVEDVCLLDLLPGKRPSQPAQLVALPGETPFPSPAGSCGRRPIRRAGLSYVVPCPFLSRQGRSCPTSHGICLRPIVDARTGVNREMPERSPIEPLCARHAHRRVAYVRLCDALFAAFLAERHGSAGASGAVDAQSTDGRSTGTVRGKVEKKTTRAWESSGRFRPPA